MDTRDKVAAVLTAVGCASLTAAAFAVAGLGAALATFGVLTLVFGIILANRPEPTVEIIEEAPEAVEEDPAPNSPDRQLTPVSVIADPLRRGRRTDVGI